MYYFKDDALPSVMVAVFIEQPTPFMEEFLEQILDTDYPKEKIHLFLRNNVEYHEAAVEKFAEANSKKFATVKRIKPSDFITESEARNFAKWVDIEICDSEIDCVSDIEQLVVKHLYIGRYFFF